MRAPASILLVIDEIADILLDMLSYNSMFSENIIFCVDLDQEQSLRDFEATEMISIALRIQWA